MLIDSERGTFASDCPNCTPICTQLWRRAFPATVATLAPLADIAKP